MATALDLDEGDRREPVIASSNRAADIEPYVKGLFAEDPKKWMQILPWEFPYGECQVEQQFLRQFFTDREIRKQGGATPPGHGYRFLKQVWVWAAMWNANQRIPMITWDWMEKNQDVVNDPQMLPHLLSKEVKPSTFFTPEEIDMYGEKVLVYAVNGIQALMQQRADQAAAQAPESGQDNAEGAGAANVSGVQDTTEQTHASLEQPVVAPSSPLSSTVPAADRSAVAKVDNASTTTTTPKEPVAVTIGDTRSKAEDPSPAAIAPAVTGDPAIVEIATADAHRDQPRNFSSGSNAVEDRQPLWRRGRGNQGKRNSINQPRHSPRGPPSFGDPRHVSNPYPSSYGGPPAQMSPMPPGSAPVTHRFPSGSYPSPMAPMPILPQGQQVFAPPPPPGYPAPTQQPYGSQMPQQHMYLNTTSPAAGPYQYGPAPNAYMPAQPFADRSNLHPNTRHFSNEQAYYQMGDQPNQRFGRRDSVQSRGMKGRGGYGGSIRGRGRGRGSLSGEGQFMARTGTSEINTAPLIQHHNTFRTEREGDWHGQQWQARGLADSSLAQGNSYTSTERGQTRYPPKSYQGHGQNTYGSNEPRAGTAQPPFYNKTQPCTAGCTNITISETCRTATKLIVFNVAPSLNMDEGVHFFSGFGRVLQMSEPRQGTTSDGRSGKYYLFVTFDDVSAARKCIASRGTQWPGGMLLVEVAKEHWNPDRFRAAFNYHRLSNASGAPTSTVLPAQELQVAPPQQQATDRQAPPTQHEPQSGYSTPVPTDSSATPTPSQGGTPQNKKSKKKQQKKNKKRAETLQNTSSEGAGESEHAQHDDARQHPEKSEEDASSTLIAEDTKKPEEGEKIGQDVPPAFEGANVEVMDETVPKAGDGDSTPTAPSAEPMVVSEKTVSLPDETAESDNVVAESAQSIKHDDDLNDESFHTASGSPEAEKELVIAEGDGVTTRMPPDQEETQEGAAVASFSDVDSVHGSESVPSESSAKSPSPGKNSKKASVPEVASQKSVTIAVPPVDTEKAMAFGRAQSDALQVPQQRSTSGGSEPKTPAFVTAPSTAAVPDTPQEPRSKKAPKQKGPDQTESFSIFSKPKRKASKAKDKKSVGKRKGSTLETFDDTEMTDQTKESSIASEALEKSGTKQEERITQSAESQHEKGIAEPVTNPTITFEDTEPIRETPADMQGDDDSEMSSKAAGKRPVGRSDVVTSASDDTATSSPSAAVAVEKQEMDAEQEEGVVGLGISAGQTVEGSKKKGKKKSSKRNKKGPNATVEVTEMSHPGVDNLATKSAYEFKGADLGVKNQKPKPQPNNADANVKAKASKEPEDLTSSPNANGRRSTGPITSPGKTIQSEIDTSSDEETSKVRHHLRLAEDASDLFDRSVAAANASSFSDSDTSAAVNIKTAAPVKAVEAKQAPREEEPENETVRNSKLRIAQLQEQEEQVKKAKGKQTETQ